jgi:hypothetical protein
MKYLSKLAFRIGHRGAFLLFLTVIDITYGWTFYHTARLGFDLFLPLHDWAYIWFAIAIITFVGAFLKRGDKYAFGAACAVKVAFAFEWFNLQFNAHSQVSYAWLQGVIWIAFAMTVFLISTWPERSRTRFHPLPPPPSELINKAGDGE